LSAAGTAKQATAGGNLFLGTSGPPVAWKAVALLVQKYGGTSVADPDRIRAVADHIVRTRRGGNEVVVVVSAMGKTTDDLVRLANDVSAQPGGREMDMLLTAGERISMALLTMAVENLGQPAVSFTGSQAGILTDTEHGKAKIIEVRGDRIREALAAGKVAIVAGFQGVSTTRDITTLGRGGSDTTAVALAAALRGDVCEIYTDVEGVYTADPRIVPTARKLAHVSFDEMLEMAATGGRVLALRSVEFARNHGVKVHVRSSFTWAPGTWVTEEDASMDATESMEQAIISGVTHDTSEAKVTIEQVPDRPGVAATIFRDLAEAGVNVDMIVQNVSTAGHTDISFTVPRADTTRTAQCMEKIVVETEANGFRTDERIGRVSLVGAGMKTHPGIAAKMFEVLAAEGVNIEMISTSTIRISCVVAEDDVERAVVALHGAFELEREAS
jgi:aspartate kinase